MTTGIDIWNYVGNWATSGSNWSQGAPPTSANEALISGGASTLNSAGVASTIILQPYAELFVTGGGTLQATNLTNNSGVLGVAENNGDGVDTVTLTGALNNAGQFTLGNSSLSASTTFSVAKLANSGTINLWGNENLGAGDQATLKIASAAPSVLTGTWLIHGDSLVQFASGGITTISSGAELQLDGQQSRFSIGAGTTNSALTGLSTILGTFDEEGDWSTGPGGSAVTTNTSMTNSGNLQLDIYGGDGASQMTIGGALNNYGAVVVGNSTLGASTTMTVSSLNNLGTINLWGNENLGSKNQATLNITGAGPSTITGKIYIHGDSLVEYASGGITSIASGAELQLDGQQSRFSVGAGTTNSALNGLASNYGTFDEEGNWSTGPGGSVVTTSAPFTNYATFDLDIYNSDGASTFTDTALFTNTGDVQVGNDYLSANTTMTVANLANSGEVLVDSQRTGGAGQPLASVVVKSAAPATQIGYLRLIGNSLVSFSGGAIQSIASGSEIELDGGAASISNGGGANSALKTLSSNAGTFLLRGENGFGSGITLTTTTGYTNTGTTQIDYYNSDGGDVIAFGGALVNSGTLDIGNQYLAAATTVRATSLTNTGALNLIGSASGSGSPVAELAISGSASAAVTNRIEVGGNADLSFGSGTGIMSVSSGGWLELDSVLANVSIGAGAQNSGLANLASNAGTFLLRGNVLGSGGATVTTQGAFSNTGKTYIDGYGNGDGGSTFNVGGALTNTGSLYIGNQYMGASTTVTATSLRNSGNLYLAGNNGGATSASATLAISGAAIVTVNSYTLIIGHATLSFGSGLGYTSISSTGWLEVDGAQANVTVGANGAQNSGLANLSLNNGNFLLRGDLSSASGGATVTTTSGFSNNGTVYIDGYGGSDGGSTFNIGGVLNNSANFDIGNQYLSAATLVTATSFLNTGNLQLIGNQSIGGPEATFDVSGAAAPTVTSVLRVSGNAKLDFGSGTGISVIAKGGTVELDGQGANIAIGAGAQNSGVANLASNAGVLAVRGDQGYASGGVTLTTNGSFTNSGTTYIDSYGGSDGGSTVTFGGTLINKGNFYIGNQYLAATTTVSATGLANTGTLNVIGNQSTTGPGATLTISGASPGVVSNIIRVEGVATLSFGSGNGLTSVATGASLEIDGAEANVKVAGGAQNSGLSKLSSNAGMLLIRGDTGFANGAVNITTTTGFSNTGTVYVDYYGGDGGSSVAFGGALTNQGNFSLGNIYMPAASTVTATSLSNLAGTINLSGSGSTATMSISGVANNYATVNVGTGSALSVTGAYTQYGGGTTISGTLATSGYTQYGGATTVNGALNSSTVNDRGGSITFNSALTSASATTSLTMQNGAALEFNAAVSSSQTVTFQDPTGTLYLGSGATGGFDGTIGGFVAGDEIDLIQQSATSLSYSGGMLDVFNGSTQIAALHLTGSYSTSSFTLAGDGNFGVKIFV